MGNFVQTLVLVALLAVFGQSGATSDLSPGRLEVIWRLQVTARRMGASAKSPLRFLSLLNRDHACMHHLPSMQYGIITVVLVGLTIYRAFFNAETTLWQVGASTVCCPFPRCVDGWTDDGSPTPLKAIGVVGLRARPDPSYGPCGCPAHGGWRP